MVQARVIALTSIFGQSDCTVRESKNQIFFKYWIWLVARHKLRVASINEPQAGHSHDFWGHDLRCLHRLPDVQATSMVLITSRKNRTMLARVSA